MSNASEKEEWEGRKREEQRLLRKVYRRSDDFRTRISGVNGPCRAKRNNDRQRKMITFGTLATLSR